MEYTIAVPIALIGWVPLALVLFALLPPRRALLATYIGGWLFLPLAGYEIKGLPDYDKVTATNLAALLGVLAFNTGAVLRFRPRWIDLPMAVFCLCPIASSLSNELGLYDGLSAAFRQTVTWGIPYFFGRIYFQDFGALKDLAAGIVIGGLVYVPFCLWEIRMSPQLHRMIYGFATGAWFEKERLGGYRPTVFMQTGLAVGMWMAAAGLVAAALAMSRSVRHMRGVPTSWLAVGLVGITVLCKSLGAISLMLVGLAAVVWAVWRGARWHLLALAATVPLYIVGRMSETIESASLIGIAERVFSEDRVTSLAARFRQEEMLGRKAFEKPLWGWGGWRRAMVVDEDGRQALRGWDSLWIITFGERGLTGLISIFAVLLAPMVLLVLRSGRLGGGDRGVVAGLAVVVVLWAIDNLFNAMLNPVFVCASGALASLGVLLGQARRRQAAAPAVGAPVRRVSA